MGKKTLIQIILLIFLIVITFLFFKVYYNSNSDTSLNKENLTERNKEIKEVKKDEKNLIQNISYTANNNKGDVYLLLAETGEIYLDNPDLMFLTKVDGKITLKDGEIITVNSDFANFNTKTFETTFINNVGVKKSNEVVTGAELYLVLEEKVNKALKSNQEDKNLIRVSRNVFYTKPGYTLSADILEIDLITKNIKIYMTDKYKKVIATTQIK